MVDSAGVSNLGNAAVGDPLTLALPQLGNLANTIHRLVQEGLTADEAAEKIAKWVDPQLVPALETLATVLRAIQKYMPGAVQSPESGGE